MNRDVTVRGALAQSGLVPLDAQVLLAHALGKDRAWLVAHGTMRCRASGTERFSRWPGAAATASRSRI